MTRQPQHAGPPSGMTLNYSDGRQTLKDDSLEYAGIHDGAYTWVVRLTDEEFADMNAGRARPGVAVLPGKTQIGFIRHDQDPDPV